MIYYVLPTLAFIGSLLKRKFWTVTTLSYWHLLLIIALGIGMLRGENIGTDYITYKWIFETCQDTEAGFELLIELTRNRGFHFFLALVFLISFYIKWLSFKFASIDPFLSLTLYFGFWFLVYDLNGIRQGLALGFCCLAVAGCIKKISWWYTFSFVMIGVCCHYSMAVFIPFLFLYKRCYNIAVMIALVICAFVLSYLKLPLKLIDAVGDSSNYMLMKVVSYSLADAYNSNILLSLSTFLKVLIFLIILYFVPKLELPSLIKSIFVWGAFLSLFTYLILSNVEIIATRGSLYFRSIELFSLAAIPTYFHQYKIRLVAKCFVYFYVILQVESTLAIPDGNLLPYHLLGL